MSLWPNLLLRCLKWLGKPVRTGAASTFPWPRAYTRWLRMELLEDRLAPTVDPTFRGGLTVAAADIDGDRIPDFIGAPSADAPVRIAIYAGVDGRLLKTLTPFEEEFTGGAFVAVGDVSGDGKPEVIVSAASGEPRVVVLDPLTGAVQAHFLAYDMAFGGGVRLAVGDVDGDGRAEIVTAAGTGGGPHIRVFDGAGRNLGRDYMAYDSAFRGGASVAVGDTDGDGVDDIITGAGTGGGPHVVVVSGRTGITTESYFAYSPGFQGGVWVAAGDVDGNGLADVITGAGVDGGSHVRVFAGHGTPFAEWLTYEPEFHGGVRVAAADLNGDGFADVITGPGVGGGPRVTMWDGYRFARTQDFFGVTDGEPLGFGLLSPPPRTPLFDGVTFVAPGAPGTRVRVASDVLRRFTDLPGELGVFRVDDREGRVGSLLPGAEGYGKAALAPDRRTQLFTPDAAPGTGGEFELEGGTRYGFYLIRGGRYEDWVASGFTDRFELGAVFPFATANPGGTQQFRVGPRNRAAFEDVSGLDSDFNDVIVDVRLAGEASDLPGGAILAPNELPANRPPEATNDAATTEFETPVLISVLSNDIDLDGNPLSITSATKPTHGTLRVVGSRIDYTPDTGFEGIDAFSYTIADGRGGTDTAGVIVTVGSPNLPPPPPTNRPPVAADDVVATAFETAVTIDVLANDTDPDTDPLSVTGTTQPLNGSVRIVGGRIEYAPAIGFRGIDTFEYTIEDGRGGKNTAVVTVSVGTPIGNNPPVARDDTANTRYETTVAIDVLANDTDPDGDPLIISLAKAPTHGTARLSGNRIEYSPASGFAGADTLTYTVRDGRGGTSTATVRVSVELPTLAMNRPPDAVNDTVLTAFERAVSINVLANDTDPDGDPLTVAIAAAPLHGTVRLVGTRIEYTPDAGYRGVDVFHYAVADGHGGGDTASVSVTVEPPAPVQDFRDWTPAERGGSAAARGTVSIAGTTATLREGDSFVTTLSRSFTVVSGATPLQFTFTGLQFDSAASSFVKDSFEAALVDSAGNALVSTYSRGRDAFFNVTDGQTAVTGAGTSLDAQTVTLDLSAIPVGTAATLIFRLVNNDFDRGSAVTLTSYALPTTVKADASVKFFVVDPAADKTFRYGVEGLSAGQFVLPAGEVRGVASSPAGNTVWTVDRSTKQIRVFDATGNPLGNWTASDAISPEGITVNNGDLWLVDRGSHTVRHYTGGAVRRSGAVVANDSFALAGDNTSPSDLVTDGSTVWVTDDGRAEVFVYDVSGAQLGRWHLDGDNAAPSGITRNPAGGSDLWVLDRATRQVFQYSSGANFRSGPQAANGTFNLALGNSSPEGIADPPITDPDDFRGWQGANVGTFAQLYLGSNTPENRQIIIDQKLLDDGIFDTSRALPASLIEPGFNSNTGRSLDASGNGSYDYTYSGFTSDADAVAAGSDIDDRWFQSLASIEPGRTVYELPAPSVKAAVFPTIDHGPLPLEAIESTAYLSNDGITWNQAVVQRVWLEGWQPNLGIKWDGFVYAVGTGTGETFRFVSLIHGGPGALQDDGDNEINAVVGLNEDFSPARPKPPSISVSATGRTFTAGSETLLSGLATADQPQFADGSRASNRIVSVTVNGTPVDLLDDSGDFWANVSIRPGENGFRFVATDAFGLTAETTITLSGETHVPGRVDASQFVDLTSGFRPEYARTSFRDESRTLFADVAVRNISQYPAGVPLYVAVKNISDPVVVVTNAAGTLPDGTPYYDFTGLVTGGAAQLEPDAATGTLSLTFSNPNRSRFTYDLVFLGVPNHPPAFTTIPELEGAIGREYRYGARGTDPDGDVLHFKLRSGPAGMSVDETTGIVTWTPTETQVGNFPVTLLVDDRRGGTAEQTFAVVSAISRPNRPPVFTSMPATTAQVGQVYRYDADATDPDRDVLTYSLASGFPAGMAIDATTGVITWTPTFAQLVDTTVTVIADDGHGGTARQNYSICVLNGTNRPPVIVSTPVTVAELTSSTTGLDPTILVPVGFAARTFDFDTELDGIAISSGGAYGHAIYAATSGRIIKFNLFDESTSTFAVGLNTGDSRASGLAFDNGAFGTGFLYATQDDGSVLVIDPTGSVRTLSRGGSIFSSNDLVFAKMGSSFGTNLFVSNGAFGPPASVSAIDSTGQDRQFTPASQFADATPVGLAFAPAGSGFGTSLYATVSNGIIVAVDANGLRSPFASGLGFPVDLAFGLADFGNYLYISDPISQSVSRVSSSGQVTAFASGFQFATSGFDADLTFSPDGQTLYVANGSKLTIIHSIPTGYTYNVAALDPDGGPLTYSLTQAPTGMTINAAGRITWAPTPTSANQSFPVTVRVDDGRGGSDVQKFTVTVTDSADNSVVYDAVQQFSAVTNPSGPWTYGYRTVVGGNFFIRYEGLFPRWPDVDFWGAGGPEAGGDPAVFHTNTGQTVQESTALIRIDELTLHPGPTGEFSVLRFKAPQDGIYTVSTHFASSDVLFRKTDVHLIVNGVSVFDGSVTFADGASYNSAALTLASGDIVDCVVGDGGNGWDNDSTGVKQVITLRASPAVPPVVGPPPNDSTAIANSPFRLHLALSDSDGNALNYSVVSGPDGLMVHPTLGVVAWVPKRSEVGTHQVVLKAVDAKGNITLVPFAVTVVAPNTLPVITSTPPAGPAVMGLPFTYAVAAQDAEDSVLTYKLEGAPTGVSISATGIVSWTPALGQLGTVTFTVVVKDSKSAEARQVVSLTVATSAVNHAPSAVALASTSAWLGRTYVGQVAGSDGDGDPLGYTLSSGPVGLSIDAASGLVTWQPVSLSTAPESVAVLVSDGRGGETAVNFAVTVLTQAANRAPAIISVLPRATSVGSLYSYNLAARDPDGDPVVWDLVSGPQGASLDPRHGTLRWTPAHDQIGPVQFTVRARDPLTAEGTQTFTVNVSCENQPPSVASTPPTTANAGFAYLYAVRATDAEGDPLTFSFAQAPAGMAFVPGTSLIRWTPTTDQAGPQNVVIRMTDAAGNVAEQSFTVVVSLEVPNRPPVITSRPVVGAAVGRAYSYQVTARDLDGDSITYALGEKPDGMTISPSGLIAWTPTSTASARVTVEVTDSHGGLAVQSFTLVARVNTAPALSAVADGTAPVGGSFRVQVRAIDPEGDLLTFRLDQAPAGMTIDAQGRIAWTAVGPPRKEVVTVTVLDPDGLSGSKSFTISVVADTSAPKVTVSLSHTLVNLGLPVTVSVRATDNVGVSNLTLAVVQGTTSQSLALDSHGRATFTPIAPGRYTFVASAADPSGNVGEGRAELKAVDPSATGVPEVSFTRLSQLLPGGQSRDFNPATEVASVTYLTDVFGTIHDPDGQLDSWQVYVGRADLVDPAALNPSDPFWQKVAGGTAEVNNGKIFTFDPTTLQNDRYSILVVAYNFSGGGTVKGFDIDVTGNAKLGEFRLEFTDLSLPLNGIPVQITRIYDTRDSATSNDFGYGWTLGIADAKIRETVPPGAGDGLFSEAKAFHDGTKVYLNLPDGGRAGFTFKPVAAGAALIFGTYYAPKFVADPGVAWKLEVDSSSIKPNAKGEFQTLLFPLDFNPDNYRLISPDGLTYSYNQYTGLQRIDDKNGNSVTFTPTAITHSGGRVIAIDRDGQGRVTALHLPDGSVAVRYRYDAKGNLIEVKQVTATAPAEVALSSTFVYRTDRVHYLDSYTDPNGKRAVKTEYDASGRLEAITDANGNRSEQKFDPANFAETVKDARGNPTRITYDARGNVVRSVQPTASGDIVTIYEYADPLNPDKETKVVNGRGVATTKTFDARGNTLTETTVDGTTAYAYNAQNKLTQVTDNLGRMTAYAFDLRGNLERIINPLGQSTVYTLDSLGRVTTAMDTLGRATTYHDYDQNGNPQTVLNSDGTLRRIEYDSRGEATRVIDELSRVKSQSYDGSGRLVELTDGEGKTTRYEYTGTNQTAVTDPLGNTTRYAYDAAGRKTRITDAERGVTRFTYDANGNLETVTDPVGNATRFVYDEANRLVRETEEFDPADPPRVYEYDAAGNRVKATDRDGRVRTFAYDAMNRQTSETWLAANGSTLRAITSTYDHAGNLLTTSDPDAALAYTYDALNRLRTATTVYSGSGLSAFTLTYGYDANGNRTSVTDTAGVTVTSVYGDRNQLASRTWSGGGIDPAAVAFNYYANGGRKTATRTANGNTVGSTAYTYYANGLSKGITHTSGSGGTLAAYSYQYDDSGRLTAETHHGDGYAYGYDRTGQLTSVAKNGGGFESFAYDKNGNRTTATGPTAGRYTTEHGNRYSSDSTFGYRYDAEGNLTRKTELATGTTTDYTWDYRNRLVKVEQRSGGGVILSVSEYAYDAHGRRMMQRVNGTPLYTMYDGDHAWADETGTGAIATRYLFGDRTDEILARWKPGAGTAFYLTDKLGTVRDLTGANGAVIDTLSYSAFGELLGQTNATAGDRFTFTGREFDAATGDYYYRARFYDATAGRFDSSDPLGHAAGDYNFYRYVANSSVNGMDPDGRTALVQYAKIAVLATSATLGIAYLSTGIIQGYSNYVAANQYWVNPTTGAYEDMPGFQNGPEDAFRHALALCWVATVLGEDLAIWLGDQREIGNSPANVMDRFNNRVGARLARQPGDPVTKALRAAETRQLQWLDPSLWSEDPSPI